MSEMIRSMFRTQFDSLDAFQKAFETSGDHVGMFFDTGSDLPLGEQVVIKVKVKNLPAPLYLEGLVAWRRLRPRGTSLPRGLFVALANKERQRLDDAITYLKRNGRISEIRAHPRFPVFSKAHYRTDRGVHPAVTRDLSMGGAFLQVRGPLLPVGANTEITLNLDGYKRENIELQAEVIRFDPLPDRLGLAVRFKPGQPGLKKLLRFLDGIRSDMRYHTVSYNLVAETA